MSRATRDGTAESVSRDQILRLKLCNLGIPGIIAIKTRRCRWVGVKGGERRGRGGGSIAVQLVLYTVLLYCMYDEIRM